MLFNLKKAQLDELEKNQQNCADLPPTTKRALFKLSQLEALIEKIKEDKLKYEDDLSHYVCITFVREVFKDIENKSDLLAYHRCKDLGKDRRQERPPNKAYPSKEYYTQLIPIITGCLAVIVPGTGKCEWFEFMKIDDEIPYVRSGGEGTGLIPPPPGGGDL